MKALKKALIIFVVALSLVSCITAYGADSPDLSKNGTLSFSFTKNGKVVSGGSILIYRVGDLVENSNGITYVWTGSFRNCGLDSTDLQSQDTANKMRTYITSNKLKGTEISIKSNGTAKSGELSSGLYFVMQTNPATNYKPINPFFISIPMYIDGEYIYNVSASPKLDYVDDYDINGDTSKNQYDDSTSITDNATSTTYEFSTNEYGDKIVTDSHGNPVTDKNGNYIYAPTDKNGNYILPEDSELPKTGRNNAYVPMLAFSGIVIVVVGVALKYGGRKSENE